ncbi:hypothetical protein BTO02_24895 [Paraburkholderia sp. SOS3]|nr:hypothetical protein BTO02_24895 [Paraburkholderia sp. SOS3]
MRIRVQMIGAIFTAFLVSACLVAHADDLSRKVTAHGLTVHYGVVPASKAAEADPTAASNAGGTRPNAYHLTVAIFDTATGKRVSDASVIASVKGPRGYETHFHARPIRKHLDVDKAGNDVTYGNDFEMPWSGIYHVALAITQKDQPKPTNIRFDYEHRY